MRQGAQAVLVSVFLGGFGFERLGINAGLRAVLVAMSFGTVRPLTLALGGGFEFVQMLDPAMEKFIRGHGSGIADGREAPPEAVECVLEGGNTGRSREFAGDVVHNRLARKAFLADCITELDGYARDVHLPGSWEGERIPLPPPRRSRRRRRVGWYLAVAFSNCLIRPIIGYPPREAASLLTILRM